MDERKCACLVRYSIYYLVEYAPSPRLASNIVPYRGYLDPAHPRPDLLVSVSDSCIYLHGEAISLVAVPSGPVSSCPVWPH